MKTVFNTSVVKMKDKYKNNSLVVQIKFGLEGIVTAYSGKLKW